MVCIKSVHHKSTVRNQNCYDLRWANFSIDIHLPATFTCFVSCHNMDVVSCKCLFTQTGQSHSGQVYWMQWIWSFVQSSDKLEVEDPSDQTTDAAGWKQDHLKGRDRQDCLCCGKQQNWYPVNKSVNKLTKSEETGDRNHYWASISIILLFFFFLRGRLWWLMRINQNKSYFLLENWIPLIARHFFQKDCSACECKTLASLTCCLCTCVWNNVWESWRDFPVII